MSGSLVFTAIRPLSAGIKGGVLTPVSSGNISASMGGIPGEEAGGLPGGKTSIGGSGEPSEPGVAMSGTLVPVTDPGGVDPAPGPLGGPGGGVTVVVGPGALGGVPEAGKAWDGASGRVRSDVFLSLMLKSIFLPVWREVNLNLNSFSQILTSSKPRDT